MAVDTKWLKIPSQLPITVGPFPDAERKNNQDETANKLLTTFEFGIVTASQQATINHNIMSTMSL